MLVLKKHIVRSPSTGGSRLRRSGVTIKTMLCIMPLGPCSIAVSKYSDESIRKGGKRHKIKSRKYRKSRSHEDKGDQGQGAGPPILRGAHRE